MSLSVCTPLLLCNCATVALNCASECLWFFFCFLNFTLCCMEFGALWVLFIYFFLGRQVKIHHPAVALEGLISLWPVKQAEKWSIRTADPCCGASFFFIRDPRINSNYGRLVSPSPPWRMEQIRLCFRSLLTPHWNRDRSQHSSPPGKAADLSDGTCRAKELQQTANLSLSSARGHVSFAVQRAFKSYRCSQQLQSRRLHCKWKAWTHASRGQRTLVPLRIYSLLRFTG